MEKTIITITMTTTTKTTMTILVTTTTTSTQPITKVEDWRRGSKWRIRK